jgi:hypothetical protein
VVKKYTTLLNKELAKLDAEWAEISKTLPA